MLMQIDKLDYNNKINDSVVGQSNEIVRSDRSIHFGYWGKKGMQWGAVSRVPCSDEWCCWGA